MSAPFPLPDLGNLPYALRRGVADHRAAGAPARNFRVYASWKSGPEFGAAGPFMLSVTLYTPLKLADMPGIWRAGDRLGDELVRIDGAVGVVGYFQPARRCIGALSVWTEEAGLHRFIGLPYHLKIMGHYRDRGLPLKAAKWWADSFEVGPALARAQQLIDAGPERRVVVPR